MLLPLNLPLAKGTFEFAFEFEFVFVFRFEFEFSEFGFVDGVGLCSKIIVVVVSSYVP